MSESTIQILCLGFHETLLGFDILYLTIFTTLQIFSFSLGILFNPLTEMNLQFKAVLEKLKCENKLNLSHDYVGVKA